MSEILCRLCQNSVDRVFTGKILNKYEISYYQCDRCGLLQTEYPYWSEEAYDESINISDTGILARNLDFSSIAATIIHFFFDTNGHFLDYAGGYGIFTRRMRDIGFDFYWYDPYTRNLVARGFEFTPGKKIELTTCLECFEHFINPIEDIGKIFEISENILFTTETLPDPVPKPGEWWYYGLEHGQHISFYSEKTLEYIAAKKGIHLYSYGNIHLFTKKTINPVMFRFIIRRSRLLFSFIVQKKMKSRVIRDMNLLIGKEARTIDEGFV